MNHKLIIKRDADPQNVYDIGLEGPHNFMIEGGLFASNCFNKSHSIAYSYLTYITAYLKANYPVQFFCALMTTRSKSLQPKDWAQKAPQYVNEAKQLGVHINSPSVNASNLEFTIADNEIYFGLNAIRDVGKTASQSIVKARGQSKFKDVFDFIEKVNTQKVNTKTFSALVKAGAFDKMGYSRIELEEKTQEIYDYYRDVDEYYQRELDIQERDLYNAEIAPKIERRNSLRKIQKAELIKREKGKRTLSEMDFAKIERELEELESQDLKKKVSLKAKEEPTKPVLSRHSKVKLSLKQVVEQANYIGCYIDVHPVSMINARKEFVSNLFESEYAKVAAVVTSFREITTKRGQKMGFMMIDDSQTICEAVIFPNTYQKLIETNLIGKIEVGSLVLLEAMCQSIDPIKLIVNGIVLYEE